MNIIKHYDNYSNLNQVNKYQQGHNVASFTSENNVIIVNQIRNELVNV